MDAKEESTLDGVPKRIFSRLGPRQPPHETSRVAGTV
jgi:hypothetical protein